MGYVLDFLSLLLKLFTAYTAVIAVFFLLPQRRYPRREPQNRFAVLVPARNEEAAIGATVRQLLRQNYPRELFDVIVIPNNCSDDTARAAGDAGARVMACTVPVKTKGQVLRWAFRQLELAGYDAYCVFDADNHVDPDFLARMNDAFCAGARVAKGLQRASNPGDSWVAGCYDLYIENFNLLYSRPRAALGLSAKLIGTGFAVSRELIREMGFDTVTLTEDTEFAVQCALRGVKVWWVPEALTYDEEPVTFRVSLRQRRRWSSGVVQCCWRYMPKLLAGVFSRRGFLCWDLAMLIAGPLMQVLGLGPGLWGLWQAVQAGGWVRLLMAAGSFWLGMCATALALAVLGRRPVRKMWKSILLYPLFTASWYPLHVLSVFCRTRVWRPIPHHGTVQAPRSFRAAE